MLDGVAADRVLIRAESVPFRPHRGIYVVVEGAGASDTAAHEAALMATEGVAGLWTFGSGEASDAHPWKPGDQRITVAWLDADPNAVAAAPRAGRAVAYRRDLRRAVRDDHSVGMDLVRRGRVNCDARDSVCTTNGAHLGLGEHRDRRDRAVRRVRRGRRRVDG